MGLLSTLIHPFVNGFSFHNPNVSIEQWADAHDAGLDLMPTVTPDTAMRVSAVYSCVKVISEDISIMDVEIQKKQVEGDQVYWVTDYDHYLNDFFSEPAPYCSWATQCEAATANSAKSGNGFLRVYRDNLGRPMRTEHREYHEVEVLQDLDKDSVVYHVTYDNGSSEYLYPWEMLHIKAFTTNGKIGISAIGNHRNTIAISMQATNYANETYASGGYGGGIITHPADLSATARKRISEGVRQKQIERKYPVLDEGMKFHPNKLSPADLDYINMMKFSRAEINSLFRVALHLTMQNEHSTKSGTEDDSLNHVNRCLLPWVNRWEDELKLKFLSKEERRSTRIKFNLDTFHRASTSIRMEKQKALALMQIAKVNELRAMNNLPPVPDGDRFVDFQKTTPQNIGQSKKDSDEQE